MSVQKTAGYSRSAGLCEFVSEGIKDAHWMKADPQSKGMLPPLEEFRGPMLLLFANDSGHAQTHELQMFLLP